LTSKIHAVVDALGNPVRWLLTGGEVADITQAKSLLDGLKADAVLADKGYDADLLIDRIHASGAMAVIPPSAIVWSSVVMIGICIKTAIWWNVFLTGSSNSGGSQRVMKNWRAITCHFLTSFAPISGSLNC
jgi:transposase